MKLSWIIKLASFRLTIVMAIGAVISHGAAELRAQDAPVDGVPEEVVARPSVDPTVATLLATEPTTPAELARVARILVELNALEPARGLIAKLLAAQADAETLADLAERFGTATFVKWKFIEGLNPEATELADAVMAAARQRAHDPARIAALIEQLSDPDLQQRRAATELLRTGGAHSVNALLSVLADRNLAEQHAHVKAALAAQRQAALGPLLAALEAPDVALRADVAEVIGRLGDASVSEYLLAPALAPDEPQPVRTAAQAALKSLLGKVLSSNEAAARLYRQARIRHESTNHASKAATYESDDPATVGYWTWDAAAGQAVIAAGSSREASIRLAARLARDARRLAPEDHSIRRLHLATLLESVALGAEGAAAQGAAELVATEGVDVVSDLLAHSAASGHVSAAAGAATVLGRTGDARLLHRSGARPSPLVEAMRHRDPRIRFAAVAAVMAIDPQRPYPGSSYLPKALRYFLASAGRPRALVAGVNPQEAQRQAGLLIEAGYDAQAVFAAAEVQRAASRSSDYELLLIDWSMAAPHSGDLIQRLRRDDRTSRLPIAVVSGAEDKRSADEIAGRFDGVTAIVRPPNVEALRFQIVPLLRHAGTGNAAADRVDAEQRLRYASAALAWAAELLARKDDAPRRRLYDLSGLERPLLDALWTPALSAPAARVLALMGEPAGQRALVEMASRATQPIAVRQASATAFRENVKRHGILLTSSEMLRQYDRYNQSEHLDRETQLVLGSILDTLENR